MLPVSTSTPAVRRSGAPRSKVKHYIWIYLRRFFKPSQMDFQYTAWTMLQLLVSPKTAYRHTSYHRQTKDHWARDDPAFVVILVGLVTLLTAAYCLAFGPGFWKSMGIISLALVRDFLLVGGAISLVGWLLATRLLWSPRAGDHHTVDQRMEFMYAYDVHCNALLHWMVIVDGLQLMLSPLLLSHSFLGSALSCTLYFVGAACYLYITFLGYSVLPGLDNTVLILAPIAIMAVLFPVALLFRFNPTKLVLWLYFGYWRP